MKIVFHAFYFALSYFSIIPVWIKDIKITNETYKYTLVFLPLIGVILAGIVIGINFLLIGVFNPLYAAFTSAVIYLFLYGFLHLEAVCDVVDALFAAHGNKEAYSIMKEPTIGAIGAMYTFSLALLKVGAITYLLYEEQYILFLTVLMFSRINFIYLLGFFNFNKNSFLSLAFQEAGATKVKLYALLYILFAFLISSNVLVLFSLSLVLFYLILKKLNKKFGFVNGDCLGFTFEHVELILLNIALVLI